MPADLLLAWLVVSLLYMLSAVYFKVRYNGQVSWYKTGSLFFIGAAILLAINRYWWFYDLFSRRLVGAVALLLFFVGWALAALEIRRRARLGGPSAA